VSRTSIKASLKAIECPVCLEYWGEDHTCCTLPCGHSLCISHLHDVKTCPICRAAIPRSFNAKPSYGIMTMARQISHLCSQLETGAKVPQPPAESVYEDPETAKASPSIQPERTDRWCRSRQGSPSLSLLQSRVENRAASRRACWHHCELSLGGCCEKSDRRPFSSEGYEEYIDGLGWQRTATRHKFYCPTCRERISHGDLQCFC
jgi:hypothetical protein